MSVHKAAVLPTTPRGVVVVEALRVPGEEGKVQIWFCVPHDVRGHANVSEFVVFFDHNFQLA